MSNRSHVHIQAPLLGAASVEALAETFKVLGDATRVRILDALSREELCVQDVADLLHLTPSAVSHQLRLLRSMRLVRTRRDGRLVFYALDDDHIVKLFAQGLEHVEERAAGTRGLRGELAARRRRTRSARESVASARSDSGSPPSGTPVLSEPDIRRGAPDGRRVEGPALSKPLTDDARRP